jgi:hypothetical protein
MWKNDRKNHGKLQAAIDRPIDSRQASEATSTIGLEELRIKQLATRVRSYCGTRIILLQ